MSKEELLKDMNDWAKEVEFFTNADTNFTDFDVVETGLERTDIVIKVENGSADDFGDCFWVSSE